MLITKNSEYYNYDYIDFRVGQEYSPIIRYRFICVSANDGMESLLSFADMAIVWTNGSEGAESLLLSCRLEVRYANRRTSAGERDAGR